MTINTFLKDKHAVNLKIDKIVKMLLPRQLSIPHATQIVIPMYLIMNYEYQHAHVSRFATLLTHVTPCIKSSNIVLPDLSLSNTWIYAHHPTCLGVLMLHYISLATCRISLSGYVM